MRPIRGLLLLFMPLWLAACGGPAEPVWAPDEAVRKYAYAHAGPPEIRLYTVVSTRNGSGGHSGLLISTPAERILFDPAGTFGLPFTPERNDVHFGMTENAVRVYIDYHARIQYHVVIQEIEVSPAVAELVMQRAMAYGAVPKAQCTKAITAVLRGVPGFESIPSTWFPKKASEAFGRLPGVTTRTVYDDDPSDNSGFIAAYGV